MSGCVPAAALCWNTSRFVQAALDRLTMTAFAKSDAIVLAQGPSIQPSSDSYEKLEAGETSYSTFINYSVPN